MQIQDIQDYLEDQKLPYLKSLISICSNFSEHQPYLIKMESIAEPEPESVPEIYPALGETNNIHEEEPEKPEIKVKDEGQEIQQVEQFSCSCSKSHCLQMYCSCFHNGRVCGKSCKCQECENAEDNIIKREKAVNYAKKKAQRNKKVPEGKIFETTEIWGCNCSKTRCVKNYCECFIRGKKCSVECNCQHCDNGKDEDLINEIKRQNQIKKRIRKERQLQQ
ncbi:unnamed protein product (macronuclear) [Paramecium tetraurelia]|uniref:CRC domain-containing protein n=1 Tax=Paramecium tetraurelia TaxID=5888 RepID=A0E6Y6_PARTE|nr:uncharacterized protein GSPATT00023781001 [Paramecium tetraurelia]CAK91053.1 unnamed protein product [Paramecium tetraurelia]|eukprot:XP_001458450.1 hypothetical protein (macronuclear) [Paramecium tetraurelia strain d4-2]